MKPYSILLLIAPLLFFSCKQKKKAGEQFFFVSVTSLVKAQIAHVDTSLYSIMKIVSTDSLHTDTSYVKREDFAEEAKEFLNLPELSDPDMAEKFREESRYDSLIKKAVIAYYPVNEKEEVQKIELLASISDVSKDGNNKVTNIIVEKGKTNRNGSVIQKMYWNTDKSFTIITFSQTPGEQEKVTTTRIIWNDDIYQ
jgi:hypothetical protein